MPITFDRTKIPTINNYKVNRAQKFMKGIAEGGLSRFILLEACVEAGRTYNAYKRGGFDEARERITEEFTAAVFWLGGVQFFNAIIDLIGKRVLKLDNVDFACAKDSLRNPLENFVKENTKGLNPQEIEAFRSKITKYKGIKAITSVLLANIMIGFVVPKINQAITRYYHRNDNNKLQEQATTPKISMDKFMKNQNPVSFGSGTLFYIANKLETDATWQLLSQDIGTAGGRTISARNNDERREILIRDVGSIFFYMFNMPLINMLLNKIEDGRTSRVDSINATYLKDSIIAQMKDHLNKETLSSGEMKELLMGNEEILQNKEFNTAINKIFEKGPVTLEEFTKQIEDLGKIINQQDLAKYSEIAKQISGLQPEMAGVKLISKEQAIRVFQGGLLNEPEFLKNLYSLNYGVNKKTKLANFLNPFNFINNESIESVNKDLKHFAQKIIDSGENITKEMLEKAVKKNFRMNILNWGSGFAISALFLSTLIPKLQYWVTKKRTGSDEFPGTKEFRKE